MRAFKKEYDDDLKLKKESDASEFTRIENSLIGFLDRLSKFDDTSTTLIYQEQISFVVSLVESCFKLN